MTWRFIQIVNLAIALLYTLQIKIMDIRHAHEKLNISTPVQGRRKEIKVVRSGISCDKNNRNKI